MPPGVEFVVARDTGPRVENSVADVQNALVEGAARRHQRPIALGGDCCQPIAGVAGLVLLAPAVSVAARAWTVAARPCGLRCTHP